MKKLTKLVSVLIIALLLSCSSDDGGNSTSGDAIIGKWKFVSGTENGIALEPEECDSMESTLFSPNGDFTAEDYDLENGICVLQDLNEPNITVNMKWEKIAENSYEVKFFINGQESPMKLAFTTVFSNNNKTVTTTTTEEDGDIVVSVLEKV